MTSQKSFTSILALTYPWCTLCKYFDIASSFIFRKFRDTVFSVVQDVCSSDSFKCVTATCQFIYVCLNKIRYERQLLGFLNIIQMSKRKVQRCNIHFPAQDGIFIITLYDHGDKLFTGLIKKNQWKTSTRTTRNW